MPLHNRDTATTGHEILSDSLREILLTALQKPTQKWALHQLCGKHRAGPFSHHFCALCPCFLIYLVGLPETNLWDVPVRECSEPGTAGFSSWPSTAFPAWDWEGRKNMSRVVTLLPLWASTFAPLLVIKERARGDNQGSKGNKKLLVQKFIPKPHSEGKH